MRPSILVALPPVVRAYGILAASLVLASVTASSQGSAPDTPAPTVRLRIIVLDTLADAQRVRSRLEAGGNFVALATTLSVDPSAQDGGLLERLDLSVLRPELRAVVQGLREGEISAVVRVPTGYAIVKVVEESEAEDATARAPGAALIATGSVRYALNVSGYGEALLALTEAPKPDGWDEDPRVICRVRTEALARSLADLERELRPGQDKYTDPFDLAQMHYALAQVHAYHGRMAQAIPEYERALEIAVARVPDLRAPFEESLGIAHLHKAEMDNGIFHAPGDQCLLLRRGLTPLDQPADAQKAIEYFSMYLARKPDDLEVRWMLNIAHMAAGSYPSQVPAAYLIPLSVFDSGEDVGLFVDVASQAGLVSFGSAGGLIVDDFDNDGRLDVVTSNMDGCSPLNFFRRTADGTFVEDGTRAGLAGQLGGLNLVHADYDNDGCTDILVLRGAWEMGQRKSLLRNDCRGGFVDVTVEAGLATPVTSTQTAVWADVDNDGRLDLFVGNERAPAQLFLQQSPGRFVDVAASAGVGRTAFTKGVAAGDFDNDGWVDFYVSNMSAPNFLYRNNGDGTFDELARAAGVPGPGSGFPVWFFDFDNDGWLDIFASSYYPSLEETARAYLRLPQSADTMKLYRNRGDGSFEDVTRKVGLDRAFQPMGANFGDIDNDGFLDIYLGTGNPSYGNLVPSVLLHNRGGRAFVDVTLSSGTGELHKGHGVAFADLDGDGDQEIVFEVGGATPGDAHALRLFDNPGHGADWLALKLVGRTSNRSALGARITVTVDSAGGRRSLHRVVGAGGSFGASPLQQHLGLGARAGRVDVDVWWPATGTRQHFSDVGKNRTLQITEGDREHVTLARPPQPLGTAARRAQEDQGRGR